MTKENKFNSLNLKPKSDKIRAWFRSHNFLPQLLYFISGIISTFWFLIRVIPKPSRAAYPCMRVAAPVMSGFVLYLLAVAGIVATSRKVKRKFLNVRYLSTGLLTFGVIVTMAITPSQNTITSYQNKIIKFGPDDGPNQPIGNALGINPGRVVWVWNPEATNENCISAFNTQDWYYKPQNTYEKVVGKMVRNALSKLTFKKTVKESWNVLFHSQNIRKSQKNIGYTKGEKIFIKINQGTSRWVLNSADKKNGYYFPKTLKPNEERRRISMGATETGPYLVLELLRELVNESGVNQADIAVGDPMTNTYGHNYDIWFAEFPGVVYTDKFSTAYGRTLISPSSNDLIYYSDKTQSDKLYDIMEKADYLINTANLKPHVWAGISLNAKNHFGSQTRESAGYLHHSLLIPREGIPSNGGYHKYRVLVDLMGRKYMGQNTLLYIVDGLFAGGGTETKPTVKYFMTPFNNDYCNSIFLSQDQVALESVCFDFLRTEWNGINKHDPINNAPENGPNMNGVDDYLHQAADSSNWPEGILYDPDNSGKLLSSLGTHEHWNNAEQKQYSRNLGHNKGIELVSIPDTLVKAELSQKK
ncbi:MAG: DUF362 domain-containing protein [Bacteroidota bacterium]